MERLGIAVDARILKHRIARPALPRKVRTDFQIAVHAFAQAALFGKADSGKRHQVRFQADVEYAASLGDSRHARRCRKRDKGDCGDDLRPTCLPARQKLREPDRQYRASQHGELGHETNAQAAE